MKAMRFQADLLTGRLSERDARRYFSRFGWFAFIFTALSGVTVSTIGRIVYNFSAQIYSHWLFKLISLIAFYAVALPIALIPLLRLPRIKPERAKMPHAHWWQGLSICITLMMLGNYVSSIILTLIESYAGIETQNPVSEAIEKAPLWGTFIFIVIVSPIIEEIVFRKILCNRLLALGERYAVILSAACFALVHGNLYQLFYAFTLGCFFSFVYVKTGKLRYTVLYHMAINFICGFLSPIIHEKANIEGLAENFVINAETVLPLVAYVCFDVLIMGAATAGAIFVFQKRRNFYLHEGLIPPPEDQAIECIFRSSGIIAALILFAIILSASIIS